MKAQRKTKLDSETITTRRLPCPPEGIDVWSTRALTKYSPKVLVGEWQTAAALQRECDQWLEHRDCSRCVDLHGAYCTWKPDVILRRAVRNGGYLYDRPPVLLCGSREPGDDCRLLHRSQLKSLYDQHYNEHPTTHPAHVDCPDSLPEGPTNFGLLDKKAAKWQEEIACLVELRTGPSLYRESYQAKDNKTKGIHVGCSDLNDDGPTPNRDSLPTYCKPSTALSKCDNATGLLTPDSHSTALDHSKDCGNHSNNAVTVCSLPRMNTTECDYGPAPAVRQAFDSVAPTSNVENEFAGNKGLKYIVTEKNIQRSDPRLELPEKKVPERELHHENGVSQFESRRTNIPECEFSRRNVHAAFEFGLQRKEVQECDFPGRIVSDSEFQRQNLRECGCPGIQMHPFTANNGTQHRFVPGMDVPKSGCARKEFPEIGLPGNDVPGWGLDPGSDLQLKRRSQRHLPPTPAPTRFSLTVNDRSDACHSCLNTSVI